MHTDYAQCILGDINIASILNMAYTIPLLVVGFLLLPLRQHVGKKTIMLTGIGIQLLGCIMIIIVPRVLPVLILATIMKSIGQSCAATMYQPMLGDAIEYGQCKGI